MLFTFRLEVSLDCRLSTADAKRELVGLTEVLFCIKIDVRVLKRVRLDFDPICAYAQNSSD